ncbi:MAG: hypothetical protein WDW36_007359 [Sanguina aurantia]
MPRGVLEIAGDLPIREVLSEVLVALDHSSGLVLQAPPGAGKTTTVPLALLKYNPQYLKENGTILVLEPRRVAAKSAAKRMASLLGEPVGQTVGYRVRLDSQVSRATRIEVVTDGILLRRLQGDPSLAGVGCVVFDEFHERGVDSDLALALCLDAQGLGRPDLRLVVMSATLGGGLGPRVASLMANAAGLPGGAPAIPQVTSEGRSYPVKVSYLGGRRPARGRAWSVTRLLREAGSSRSGIIVLPLHGSLSPTEQDEAIRPGRKGGPRRIILATPIAESSLTIDGVRVVVDSGLRRTPLYDDETAVNRLAVVEISDASAVQRAGRAGRTAPGVCYRLWEEEDQRRPTSSPEIHGADLTPLALELALWGCSDGSGLPWLDRPDAARLATAIELLDGLGAVDTKGRVTATGRRMARMGVHPRFAHMALVGAGHGAPELAALLASMLSEKDVLRSSRGDGPRSADVKLRLQALADGGPSLDQNAADRITQSATALAKMLRHDTPTTAAPPSSPQTRTAAAAGDKTSLAATPASPAGATADPDSEDLDGGGEVGEQGGGPLFDGEEAGLGSDGWTGDAEAGGSSGGSGGPGSGYGSSGSEASSGREGGGGGKVVSSGSGSRVSGSLSSFSDSWLAQSGKEGLVGVLLAAAYPDRIARRKERSNNRASFQMSTGDQRGVWGWRLMTLPASRVGQPIRRQKRRPAVHAPAGRRVVRLPMVGDPLQVAELIAIAEMSGPTGRSVEAGGNDNIRLAAGLSVEAVERYCREMITEREVVFWASGSKAVLGRRQRRLGCLLLSELVVPVTDEAAVPALLQGFKEMGGVRNLGFPKELEAWRQRIIWLRRQEMGGSITPSPSSSSEEGGGGHDGGSSSSGSSGGKSSSSIPDLSDAGLLASSRAWLPAHLSGVRSKGDMVKLDWSGILRGMVPWSAKERVEQEAPSHILLPTGTNVLIDYSRDTPTVSARIQEVYGLHDTPRLAGGRVPIVMELLAPGGQPLQSARAGICYGSFTLADFPSCTQLSPSFALHWRVKNGSTLVVGLDSDTAPGATAPWLALGLSEHGSMQGADMWVVSSNTSGTNGPTWRVGDYYSLHFAKPTLDARQDVVMLGKPLQGPGHVTAVLSRPLQTCDPDDMPVQQGVLQYIVWAFGNNWPHYHGPADRGSGTITFYPDAAVIPLVEELEQQSATQALDPAPIHLAQPEVADSLFKAKTSRAASPPMPGQSSAAAMGGSAGGSGGSGSSSGGLDTADGDPGVGQIVMHMPNVTVPSDAVTSYICSNFEVPSDRRYHVIRTHAVASSTLTHHIILYACTEKPANLFPNVYTCFGMSGMGCQTYAVGFAPGADTFVFPPEAGYPIGQGATRYFAMQTHYNNPELQEGFVDSSGFTLYYTPNLRPHDLAVLIIGQPVLNLPPGQQAYTAPPALCPSSCTDKFPTDLNIFAVTPHMHTAATRVVTRHFRGNQELAPLGRRQFYSFDFQGPSPLPDGGAVLKRGDSLVTTCTYNTTGRTNATMFGEASADEMCFTFVMYYPAVKGIEVCLPLPAKTAICTTRSNLAALDLQSVAGVPGLGSVADFMSYSLSNRSAGGLIGATNAYRKLDRQMASYVANGWLQLDVPQPSASIPPFQECPSLEATVRVSANASSSVSSSSSTSASIGQSSCITPLQLATHLCRPLAVIIQARCESPEQAYIKAILSLVPATDGGDSAADEPVTPSRSPLSSNDEDATSATSACWILEYGLCSPTILPSLTVDDLAKCLEVYAFLGLPLPAQWQQQLNDHLTSRTDLSPSGAAAAAAPGAASGLGGHSQAPGLEREPWVRLVVALAAALTQDCEPHHQHALLSGSDPLLRTLALLPSLEQLRQRGGFVPELGALRASILAGVAHAMDSLSAEAVLPLLPDVLAAAERWSEVYQPLLQAQEPSVQDSSGSAHDSSTPQHSTRSGSLASSSSADVTAHSEDGAEGTTSMEGNTSEEEESESGSPSGSGFETSVAASMLTACLSHVDTAMAGQTLPRACVADALAALAAFVERAAGGRLIGSGGHHPVAVVDRWLELMTLAMPQSQSPGSCSVAMQTVSKLLGDDPDAQHLKAQMKWCFETTEA